MASTRNINSRGVYLQQLQASENNFNYRTYENSQCGIPSSCLNTFKIPESTQPTRQVNREMLAHNAIDIESYLKGISSNNFINPTTAVKPNIKSQSYFKFYDRIPMIDINSITSDQGQRPLLH